MIEELIRKSAKTAPDKTAYITTDGEITYKELIGRAEKYADLLIRQGSCPVLIYGGKEINVLISILACIFARRTYVIADGNVPAARVRRMIALSDASLVLSAGKTEIPGISALTPDELAKFEDEDIKPNFNRTAYVAFTSGTTGEPKGVGITYENLDNFIEWMLSLEPIRDQKNAVVFNQAGFSFDLSVADIYYSLCTAGTLVAYNGGFETGMFGTAELMRRHGVTFAVMTPTFLRLCLCEDGFNRGNCPELKCIYLCGEALRKSTAIKLFSAFPDISLINAYGPTEATSAVCAALISREMAEADDIPVGTVGKCACGVDTEDGKIIITGKSVGEGYLNGVKFGGRYDTGDLGHIAGGHIYFDGRADRQIKYKGYRIELDGIEACICDIARVKFCTVGAAYTRDGTVKSVYAYVFGDGDDLAGHVREKLREKLPGYMIPKTIKATGVLPVNKNGKLDGRAVK